MRPHLVFTPSDLHHVVTWSFLIIFKISSCNYYHNFPTWYIYVFKTSSPRSRANRRLVVLLVVCGMGQSALPWLRASCRAAGSSSCDFSALFLHCVKTQQESLCAMAIVGKVHVTKMRCLQKVTHDNGHSEFLAIECKVSGSAQGLARVTASTVVLLPDDEKWRITTMTRGHSDHPTQYTDLFAASCGAVGEFTVRGYNFPLRRLDGNFYAQVFPFGPLFSHTKVHPTGAPVCPFPLSAHAVATFMHYNWNIPRSLSSCSPKFQNTGWKTMARCVLMKDTGGDPLKH